MGSDLDSGAIVEAGVSRRTRVLAVDQSRMAEQKVRACSICLKRAGKAAGLLLTAWK